MKTLAALLRNVARIDPESSLLVLLPDLQDVLVFGGLGAMAYGAGQVAAPLGWFLLGAGCFWLGVKKAG